MKNKKCVVFDFSRGLPEETSYYHYKNGQLDLDLKIEVKSPEPVYSSNIIKFKGLKKKNDSPMEGLEEPFDIA
ncbi:MAG: hypothetical protein PF693_11310 [Spirochaetia bacterium]|jgi:hypothetical protein|nr:hypothetical protein [Spirochaetia bacterium]